MTRYHLRDHARMFAARARNDAYDAALRAVVRPGSVVLDIGTGCGLFALLACRAGAARVYALETEPSISIARELATENRVSDRITFIQQRSTEVTLPERVDVVVADIRGVLPLAGGAVASLIDARERLMKRGGAIIPQRDILRGAVVSAPQVYAKVVDVWSGNALGLSTAAARAAATQQLVPVEATDVTALADPIGMATIDYRDIAAPSVSATGTWTVSPGAAHGLALWFEAELADGVGYRSGPGSGDDLYGVAFLPWPQPATFTATTAVVIDLRADWIGGAYVWTWRTSIAGPDSRLQFEQSTFQGGPISMDRLQTAARPA
jgi:protein arginine N-methyltransferase 1